MYAFDLARVVPVLAAASSAAAQTFTPLGALPGANLFGSGLSADGTVAVGTTVQVVSGTGTIRQGFRWTAATGRQPLTLPAGYVYSSASALSADGSIVVGTVYPLGDMNVAARWTSSGPPQLLGTLPGGIYSFGVGVSRDGSVVVGGSDFDSMLGPTQAFRWTAATGMQGLGSLPGFVESVAIAVSDDGSVIAGESDNLSGGYRAWRWTAATGFMDLGSLGPSDQNFVQAISGDGEIIVGASHGQPYRWTATEGMQALPTPPGTLSGAASAITHDGSVIGGFIQTATGWRAIYWDASGYHDLTTQVAAALPSGWTLDRITEVSDDGLTFLGYSQRSTGAEAWIVTLGPGPCYANCDQSTVEPVLNINDFICFQSRFAAGDPYANCDQSTSEPVLNVNDFICFQAAFTAGCR